MADLAPLGPQKLDLAGMPDGDFEEMCHRLVLRDHPDARATANPDSGADSLLPDGAGGFERGWQAKRYGGHIHWSKCKESLDRAVGTYGISHMRFFFARDLSKNQHLAFPRNLVGRQEGVTVDYWGKAEICAKLDGSEEGRRIARHYFGPDQTEREERMTRAFRAQGKLETVDDAIERKRPVGEFLKEHDPFFTYPAVEYEDGFELPGHPGAVMTVISSEGGLNERIDAVPRDDDAMDRYGPEITFTFTDDEAGRQAGEAMHRALRENAEFVGEDGIEVIFKRLPPAFEKEVGKPTKGRVHLSPLQRVPAPWLGELTARSDRWQESVTMDLKPLASPPDGWDHAFEGTYAGLTMTILFAMRGDHGERRINWRRDVSSAPATDQARAMRVVGALHGPGDFVVRDLAGGRPELRQAVEVTEIEDRIFVVIELMENLATIEEWSGQRIAIPDRFTGEDARDVAIAADRVRAEELPATFEHVTIDVFAEGIEDLRAGRPAKFAQTIGVYLFGQEVPLGEGEVLLPPYETEDQGPGEQEGMRKIVIRPVGGPASVAYKLTPPPRDEAGAVAA